MLLSGYLAGKREFTRDDVEMVAREMHDETVDVRTVRRAAEAPPRPAVPGAERRQRRRRRRDPARRLQIDAKSADEASRLLAKMQTDPIEERLTRVERRADTTVALLQQLLDAVRPQATKKQVKS